MKLEEQILFAKRLAILLKAEIPIAAALAMLRDQTATTGGKALVNRLIVDVENGLPLSAALAKQKKMFGLFAINIVKVGEAGGGLADNLQHLAEELKKQQQLKSKVKGALIYPGFIVVATLGITALLSLYVFPKILPIFTSFRFALPLPTRILMAVTNFAAHKFWLLGLGLVALAAVMVLLLRLPAIRLVVDGLIIKLPFLGKMLQSYFLANTCRTLGLLLGSNVHIVDAARIAAITSSSLVYRGELHMLAQRLARGEKISRHLSERAAVFPSLVPQMASVGEMSGNLSGSFLYLAEIYEQEVEDAAKNLSSLIEPVLMVGMGAVVGFVAISIITPIYQITQNIKP